MSTSARSASRERAGPDNGSDGSIWVTCGRTRGDGARALLAPQGILAADESTGSIKKRFDAVGVESTTETRRAYREILITTPGMEESISGAIMFDETIRQATIDGTRFARALLDRGVIPGTKVDLGAEPLALAPGETITEGPA